MTLAKIQQIVKWAGHGKYMGIAPLFYSKKNIFDFKILITICKIILL
jgi:hypothetical protein